MDANPISLPQPRKSAPWKIIVPIVIAVLLCCLCLVVIGVVAYLGTQGTGPLATLATPTRMPTNTSVPTFPPTPTRSSSVTGVWYTYYSWDCASSYNGPATLTFNPDNTFYMVEDTSSGGGTWHLQGDQFDYIYNYSPYAHFVGTLASSMDHLEGTMSTNDGSTGCWYADKK
jgi:hypothetical protein